MNRLKKYALKKVIVSTLCLFLLFLFYLYPTKENLEIKTIVNENSHKNIVYMLDNDNYISQVITYFDSNSLEDEIRKKINILTIGYDELINFHPLIPEGTTIKKIRIDKDSVYIDFSKELLNVTKYNEEHMIEAIVYTLTQINGINNIYISVEGKQLEKYPNSKKEISYPLTRSIGVNKEYNITNFNNINKTTVYFLKESDNLKYYVPVTKITNDETNKIELIINELKSTINSQNNLNGYLNSNVELVDYNQEDNKMYLVFNDYIFNDNKIIETVEYIISSSIFDNYDVDEIVYSSSVKDEILRVNRNQSLDF